MEDKTKEDGGALCPLLSINRRVPTLCKKQECAWWHASYGTFPRSGCAVVKVATQLEEIDTTLMTLQ